MSLRSSSAQNLVVSYEERKGGGRRDTPLHHIPNLEPNPRINQRISLHQLDRFPKLPLPILLQLFPPHRQSLEQPLHFDRCTFVARGFTTDDAFARGEESEGGTDGGL